MAVVLAISPPLWPPIPSATIKRLGNKPTGVADAKIASWFVDRVLPISVFAETFSIKSPHQWYIIVSIYKSNKPSSKKGV